MQILTNMEEKTNNQVCYRQGSTVVLLMEDEIEAVLKKGAKHRSCQNHFGKVVQNDSMFDGTEDCREVQDDDQDTLPPYTHICRLV